jgi:hypothetical protein
MSGAPKRVYVALAALPVDDAVALRATMTVKGTRSAADEFLDSFTGVQTHCGRG